MEELSVPFSGSADVSASVQGLEIVDRKASNAAPPSSDLGEWLWKSKVGMFLPLELLALCI